MLEQLNNNNNNNKRGDLHAADSSEQKNVEQACRSSRPRHDEKCSILSVVSENLKFGEEALRWFPVMKGLGKWSCTALATN
jgi:hypothetical protein